MQRRLGECGGFDGSGAARDTNLIGEAGGNEER